MRRVMKGLPTSLSAQEENEDEGYESPRDTSANDDETPQDSNENPEANVDLLRVHNNNYDKTGNATLFVVNGKKIALTHTEIYAHRDLVLAGINLKEFTIGYLIRPIRSKNDKAWAAGRLHGEGPGTKGSRHAIHSPCELHKAFLISKRAKLNVAAYKGAPMPTEPSTDDEDDFEKFAL